MNKESLEMPADKKRGANNIFILVAVAVTALAGWLLFSGDKTPEIIDSARRQIEDTVGGGSQDGGNGGDTLPLEDMGKIGSSQTGQDSGPAGSVTGSAGSADVIEPPADRNAPPVPQEQAVTMPGSSQDGAASGEGQGKDGAGQEGGDGISAFEPEPGPDNVDRALAEQINSQGMTLEERAALTVASGTLSDDAAPADAAMRQDSVVTMDFIHDFARWLVASYQPGDGGGRSAATLIGANIRYGNNLTGLRHSAGGPARGRAQILRYVFTPGMLDVLHRLYADAFIESMHQTTLEKGKSNRGPLTAQQEADMFAVYAGLFRQFAASMRGAVATADLQNMVAKVRLTGREAAQTSGRFAEMLIAYKEARDAGDTIRENSLHEMMVAASGDSEAVMEARNQARDALVEAIKRHAGGRVLGDDSLIYLAEWLDRRGDIRKVAPAADMAAETAIRLADQMDAKAAQIRSQQ